MEWIKCTDRLPEEEIDVLLLVKGKKGNIYFPSGIYISIDRLELWLGEKKPIFSCQRFYEREPFAWMNLPEITEEMKSGLDIGGTKKDR